GPAPRPGDYMLLREWLLRRGRATAVDAAPGSDGALEFPPQGTAGPIAGHLSSRISGWFSAGEAAARTSPNCDLGAISDNSLPPCVRSPPWNGRCEWSLSPRRGGALVQPLPG